VAAKVDNELCTGCGKCVEACPVEAVKVVDAKAIVDEKECIDCGACVGECPSNAIRVD